MVYQKFILIELLVALVTTALFINLPRSKMILFVVCLYALLSTGTCENRRRETVTLNSQGAVIIKAAMMKCSKEHGISQNVLNLIREGSYLNDDTFKKYVFCVYQESGYAKPDGHVIISKGVALYPKEINMLPVFENCDKQGADPVETTFLSFACYQETTPVLQFCKRSAITSTLLEEGYCGYCLI